MLEGADTIDERDWEAVERDGARALPELARLLRRGGARLWVTLPAVALAAIAAALFATRAKPYQAELVLLVSEGRMDGGTDMPVPPRDLESFVREVALAREPLLRLMEARGLEPELRAIDPGRAVAEMRQDIDVAVERNYFLEYRETGEGARSMRIRLHYRNADPGLAQEILRDLARLCEEALAGGRSELNAQAAAMTQELVVGARQRLEAHERQLAATRVALVRGPSRDHARLRIEIARLESAITADAVELRDLELRAQTYAMDRDVEGSWLGLSFTVARMRPPELRKRTVARVAVLGSLLFCMLLPLGAAVVGAFDRRIRDAADVRRLGLEPIGTIRLG